MLKVSYFLYALAEVLTKTFPKRLLYFFAKALATFYSLLVPQDLANIQANLLQAIPELKTKRARDQKARQIVSNFSTYLTEFFYSQKFTKEFIDNHVQIEGLGYLQEALKKKRGVIAASAHLGHWELGGMALGQLGYPIHAVAATHQNPKINQIFVRRRQQNRFNTIPLDGFLKSCYRILSRNQLLAINGDRLFGREGTPVDFFGKRVSFPKGIGRLADKTGAVVLPIFFFMKGYNQYKLEILKPLPKKEPALMTQAFASILEKKIKVHSDQWFIFQPFWEESVWPV